VSQPALLATAWRGSAVEVLARGHVVVADAAGAVLASVGDPATLTTLRSCVKPLQARPFVELAAADLGVTDDELAVACASHSAEPEHVETVRRLLARAGLEESQLLCGPQLPTQPGDARQALLEGGPRPIDNNCSGKHAAMLATCVVQGWPVSGYTAPDHACQQSVSAALGEALQLDMAQQPWGVDGCGLPTFAVPLGSLAAGFARSRGRRAFERCRAAMHRAPHLVAGSGRFDTALLDLPGQPVTGKSGAAGVWAGVSAGGLGIAVKLEAGVADALPAVVVAALRALQIIDGSALERFAAPPVRNWAGEVVGAVRAEPDAFAPLAALVGGS
jgi:L-asparaginase II